MSSTCLAGCCYVHGCSFTLNYTYIFVEIDDARGKKVNYECLEVRMVHGFDSCL
jgi:hypothetical protein